VEQTSSGWSHSRNAEVLTKECGLQATPVGEKDYCVVILTGTLRGLLKNGRPAARSTEC
jgi:hypothetical protein